jgi:hypothetical protein
MSTTNEPPDATDTTTAADAATISAGAGNDAGCDDADGW